MFDINAQTIPILMQAL